MIIRCILYEMYYLKPRTTYYYIGGHYRVVDSSNVYNSIIYFVSKYHTSASWEHETGTIWAILYFNFFFFFAPGMTHWSVFFFFPYEAQLKEVPPWAWNSSATTTICWKPFSREHNIIRTEFNVHEWRLQTTFIT